MPKAVGLCIIVKDEAHIIRRCLEAARPLIDYALIVDTGSTDETIARARQSLRDLGIDGEVIQHAWRDFAHNRSYALARLRQRSDIDYALMIDADDQVEIAEGFDRKTFELHLEFDVYNIRTVMGAIDYVRPQLISNRKRFYYKGVLHEFLECDEAFAQATLDDFHVVAVQDSARNQLVDKYRRDAATLAKALAAETDAFLVARYTFYLAQSYRDCGETEKSIATYLRRADMGLWDEEVFCSLYYAAQQMDELGRNVDEVVATYLRAAEASPGRAEALHGASRRLRLADRFEQGYEVAQRGLKLTAPTNALFVEPWIYDYGLRDEFAVNAYWAGRHRECLEACIELLGGAALPDRDRARVADNARFALGKLTEQN